MARKINCEWESNRTNITDNPNPYTFDNPLSQDEWCCHLFGSSNDNGLTYFPAVIFQTFSIVGR